MKSAFVCDTAYQVFNTLNYRWNRQEEEGDLFLCRFFPTAEMLYQKLKQTNLFANVTLTVPHAREEGEGRMHWYFRHALEYMAPRRSLEREMVDNPPEKLDYDRIFTSTMNAFAVNLLALNPGAELYLIDDGTGSHDADSLLGNISWRHRLFEKLSHRGAGRVQPRAVYLNGKETEGFSGTTEVRLLPPPGDAFLQEARELFGTKGTEGGREAPRMIWLTQPDEYEKSLAEVDEAVAGVLRNYSSSTLVRRHPRDDRTELYRGLELDHTEEMWELRIPLMKEDSTILLGMYSTAQMTPKQLYDLEPKVVFLFRLYGELFPREWVPVLEKVAERFRRSYRRRERVMIPDSTEELERILHEEIGIDTGSGRE